MIFTQLDLCNGWYKPFWKAELGGGEEELPFR